MVIVPRGITARVRNPYPAWIVANGKSRWLDVPLGTSTFEIRFRVVQSADFPAVIRGRLAVDDTLKIFLNKNEIMGIEHPQ